MLKKIKLLLLFVMTGFALHAQVTTSSITGTVTDKNAQPLEGATITATHTPSGTNYMTTSGKQGTFTISNMRIGGPYRISVSYAGLETYNIENVSLLLGEPYTINAVMTDKALETVVVAGSRRPRGIADKTGAATNITSRQLTTLPSISRSLNEMTRLTPQANGNSIGGGNYRQNFITVDGADFNNTFGIGGNLPAGGSPISLDALEEISINVTPYDVRQSGFIGSAINAVTRAGTNNFSGAIYTYFRNQRQQGDEAAGIKVTKQPMEYSQYGARFGGPIIKNKLFFFFNYETEQQPKPIQSRFASSATAPFGSATNIARPTTTELDMISNYLLTNYGYITGPYDNYTTESYKHKILGRLDWNISSKHRMNIRYSQVESSEPFPVSTSRSPMSSYTFGQGRTDNNALHFKNSNYYQEANFYSLAGEVNSTFGRRISNTFRATYTNQNDPRNSDSQIFPFVDILKDGTPFTSFGYEPFTFGNLRDVKTTSFMDNVIMNLGKHNLTLGAQADFSLTRNGFQRFATSYYTFNSWDDFVNGVNPRDFAITYSLNDKFEQAFPSFKFALYSGYVQDEIVFNQRIRMTLGLRADLPTYPDVSEIKTHPLIAALTFDDGEKINTGNLPENKISLSPRVGFNWDVYGDRSLQIRGGTGVFTGRVPFVWIVSQSGDAGMLQVTQTFVGQSNTPGPFDPDPAAYLPTTPPAAGTVIPSTITAVSENFRMPQAWKTSLAFDKRLPWNSMFSLEGIFKKDLRTAIFRNPNLIDPVPLNISGYADNRMMYGATVQTRFINRLTTAGQASPTGTQAFNTIVLDNGDEGYYFSLTGKLEKQFSNGFTANVAYTKTLEGNMFDGGGDQPLSAWQGTATVNGSNNPQLEYAGYSVPDRLIGSISYRKEYLRHLGTTITVFYEGSHQGRYSYTYSTDFNRDGTNFDLIYIPKDPSEITFTNFTYNGVAVSAAQQSELFFKYIEQDKYLREHKGQYAERNGALSPWRNQFDVRLMQDLFVNVGGKRNTIQFTVDVFNFGNMLNSDWGLFKSINASSILVPTNSITPGGTTRPTFRLASDRGAPVTQSFRNNVSIASTYYMQFGLRYIFN